VVEECSLDSGILDLLIPERKLPSGLKIPIGATAVMLNPDKLLWPFVSSNLIHSTTFKSSIFFLFFLFLLIFSPLSFAFGLESLSSKNGHIYLPMICYAPSIHK
jgi:hypothetical protein